MTVRIELSSGSDIYVAASVDEIVDLLEASTGFVRMGNRRVNAAAVTAVDALPAPGNVEVEQIEETRMKV